MIDKISNPYLYAPKTYTILKNSITKYIPRILSKITLINTIKWGLLQFGINPKWWFLVLLVIV